MRIQGQHQQFFDILLGQRLDGAGDARIAIGHGERNPYVVAKSALEHGTDFVGETLGVHRQRRPAAHPDLAVISHGF